MESHELMRHLIPDRKIKSAASFSGLNPSLIYQERREFGKGLNQTGTRNTIARLDLFCEHALGFDPDAVRIVGERYTRMYQNFVAPPDTEVSLNDLLAQLGRVSKECGEAVNALATRQKIGKCTVEVSQAKEALEKALAMVIALEEQE